MATKTPNECPVSGGCDFVSKALCRSVLADQLS